MTLLDYAALRQQVSLRQTLALLAYQPTHRQGSQWRGPCLLARHAEHADAERCFCVQVDRHLFYCFVCRRGGNQLDLWAAIHHLTLPAAALDLWQRMGLEPVLLRNTQPPNRS